MHVERLRRVHSRGWSGIPARFRAWALLIAFLPTLSFLGHWSLHVDIPGTNEYLVIVPGAPTASGTHSHDGSTETGDHGRHCHAAVASCSDIPLTGISAFALLNDSLAYLGAAGALIALAATAWQLRALNTIDPDLQPPRPSFTFA